jgi:hypothetical protein
MASIGHDDSPNSSSKSSFTYEVLSSLTPPSLPPRPLIITSNLQEHKRWSRLNSASPVNKALPHLPPPIVLGKGSNGSDRFYKKFYNKFDTWFTKKFPKLYAYRRALYVGFGLFLLGLLVIIICVGTGAFKGGRGKNNNGGDEGDVGSGGLELSGSGDGTYYGELIMNEL